jgi:hypothetical protein
MALDAAAAQELVRKLQADREAYLETVNKSNELLIQLIASYGQISPPSSQPRLTSDAFNRLLPSSTIDVESVQKGSAGGFSGEFDTDSDDGQSLSVQVPLAAEQFTEMGFRDHLLKYDWPEASKEVLKTILGNNVVLGRRPIFPTEKGPVEDRSHLTHYT